jgi:hypothetical protein
MRVRQRTIWLSVVPTLSAVAVIAVLNFSMKQKEENDAVRSCAGTMLTFRTAATLAEGEQKCRDNRELIDQTLKLREQ